MNDRKIYRAIVRQDTETLALAYATTKVEARRQAADQLRDASHLDWYARSRAIEDVEAGRVRVYGGLRSEVSQVLPTHWDADQLNQA